MSRLESLDSVLHSQIKLMDHFTGRILVGKIIADAIELAGADVAEIIKGHGMDLLEVEPYIGGCSKAHVDQLDEVYFEKDELGSLVEASKYFTAARLVSSCDYYMRAIDTEMLAEAAYEALMSKE